MRRNDGKAKVASIASISRIRCQRVWNCASAIAASSSGSASSRSIARSKLAIIWMREAASSVLLAPMKPRVCASYSAVTGAAPPRITAWK